MEGTARATLVLLLISVFMLDSATSQRQAFETEPLDIEAREGDTATLTCKVRHMRGKLQWVKDGFGIGINKEDAGHLTGWPRYYPDQFTSGDLTTSSLSIRDARIEDDADFECHVGRGEGQDELQSRRAHVTVLVPTRTVVIDGEPRVAVTAGVPYNLTCTASLAKPAANITWFSNGLELTAGTTYNTTLNPEDEHHKLMDTTSSLLIEPDQNRDQSRQYECRAKNEADENGRTSRVYLEVQYAPVVTMVEKPRRAKEQETVRFRCNATGNPNVISWKWYIAGRLSLAHKTNTLDLPVSRSLHQQTIECQADNTVGVTRKSFTLNVEYGPYFTEEPHHASADIGESVSMSCNIKGHPHLAITWRKQGMTEVLDRGPFYNITGVTERHFGVYICSGSVQGFDDDFREVNLYEKGPPVIQKEEKQWARYGEIGVISCTARCIPKPAQILWIKDNKPVNLTALQRYTVKNVSLPDGVRTMLEIVGVQDEDYGNYNCTIENGYGKASVKIEFHKKEVANLLGIIIGISAGVLLVIIIASAAFFYQRKHKSPASDSSSSSSDDSIRKPEIILDTKVEFTNSIYGSPIDAWTDQSDNSQLRLSSEYDEFHLSSSPGQAIGPMTTVYDNNDGGFGNNSYDRDFAQDLYGTYPRKGTNRAFDNRPASESPYGPIYGSEPYGSYGRSMPRGGYAASDYGPSNAPSYSRAPPAPASDYGGNYNVPRALEYMPARISPNDYDITAGPISDYGPLIDNDYAPPPASLNSRLATNV